MENALIDVIETPRCRLEPARAADLGHFVRLNANPNVRRFLGGAVDRNTAAHRFEELRSDPAVTLLSATLKSVSENVGIVMFGPHHDGSDIELSYQLLPQFWGQGLAIEIVTAAVRAMYDHLPTLSRIVAETQAANSRSRILLARLGAIEVKTVQLFDEDQIIFELRRPA